MRVFSFFVMQIYVLFFAKQRYFAIFVKIFNKMTKYLPISASV